MYFGTLSYLFWHRHINIIIAFHLLLPRLRLRLVLRLGTLLLLFGLLVFFLTAQENNINMLHLHEFGLNLKYA
jgi:hypothetical protein